MKLKKWVEATIIAITLIMSIRMFMVEEMIGCIYLTGILTNIIILDTYGTIIDKINGKLAKLYTK